MYTLDYLNCFIENLDLPEASRASLRENCETLVTTPGAIDELVSAETLLFKDYGIDEKDFLDRLDDMVEQAFDDQCTGANPRLPLMSEIKDMYLRAYYGK